MVSLLGQIQPCHLLPILGRHRDRTHELPVLHQQVELHQPATVSLAIDLKLQLLALSLNMNRLVLLIWPRPRSNRQVLTYLFHDDVAGAIASSPLSNLSVPL